MASVSAGSVALAAKTGGVMEHSLAAAVVARVRLVLVLLGVSVLMAPSLSAAEGFSFRARSSAEAEWRPVNIQLLQSAQRPWSLCVILPNLRDSYWSLVRYGVESEAHALNLSLTLIEAHGYDAIEQQRELIQKRCLDTPHDALILAAVDHSALNGVVREVRAAGLPVIDLINGISAPEVSARVAVDYGDLANALGHYMVEHFVHGQVLWQPGPEGSHWTLDADNGFKRAIAGSSLTVAHSYRARPFVREQREQLQQLAQQVRFNRVAGTAVTAEAAVSLRDQLPSGTEIFSYYYNPRIHRLIGCGRIKAALYDYPALQGRVAVDQAVRVLERQPFEFHLASDWLLLTADNLDQTLVPFLTPPDLMDELTVNTCSP
ncbi:MAG TPA: TMAO reductase system periplasmic protein TorT [Motiliproteus sp.]